MAKFEIRNDLTKKPLYAGVGVTDLAVERVRGLVTETQKRIADAQKNVRKLDRRPTTLRDRAVSRVNARVDALAKDAKALPNRVQDRIDDNLATVNGVYDGFVSRGESLVTRVRRQESTKATTSSARTTTAKAKTTKTQASKATKSTAKKTTGEAKKTASTAKKTATTAQKTAATKSAPAKSSAKATATAAKQTAGNAAQAAGDAAAKVGD